MRIIAGPCQAESLEHSLMIAKHCKAICDEHDIEYVFKASFDKANRSSDGTQRGLGLGEVMSQFGKLKKEITDLKILTDVHNELQVDLIAKSGNVDVIQIPAFLCRQTDLVKAACATDMIVNIKKGQFLAPWDMKGIMTKTTEAKEVWITERGTSFGYNNLVVDFTGVRELVDTYGNRNVVMDATHSVQKPGGGNGVSGGNRYYAPHIANCAAAVGVTNFFLEVHEDPDNAPSDGPNMIKLEDFEKTILKLKQLTEIQNEL